VRVARRGPIRLQGAILFGAATLILLAAIAPAGGVAAAEPRASLPDIEDEVMCPICGTLLELSEAPQADRERAFIRRQIAAGRSKQQIKDALVAEYGRTVLATPQGSGFDLAAYLVPILGFVAGLVAILLGVRRWRRSGRRRTEPSVAPPDSEAADRLDSDLARYDL
jgi:cytochrome c-type biogenesis protein CcmH